MVTKGSGDEGKWWRWEWWGREVVRKGSGEEGKWWRREVVKKGSDDEGEWWRREVVRKGSGEEGKWWRREAVKKGSDDEGEWWRREVVRKGSGDEGKRWRREVMMKGSGDEGKWWGREVVTKGSGEEGKWWWRGVVRKGTGNHEGEWCMMLQGLCFGEEAGARNLVFFRVKWLQATMKGTSSVRRVRLRSVYRFFLPQCNGGFKLLWVCLCVRSYRVFWNLCLQIALEWLHDVARALFWGGSWSTKPCVFPCKVAAGDDERYLVCAAGAAAVGLSFFFCRSVTVASSCFGCACVCVVIGCFGICACRSHWNGRMMLQGLCFGEEAGARNLVFFPCKVAAGDDERYLVCAAGAAAVGLSFFFCRSVTVASSCFGCACVCVVIGCFGICACRSHWNGCMMLQGLCFGEEAGARNLVFFHVKWLQATMKGTSSVQRVRLRSVYRFFCRSVTVASSCFGCACVWVVIGCFGICACRSHWNGCMMLQGLCFGEEAGARNLVFFRASWLQATMKGTSSVRRVRLRSVYRFFCRSVTVASSCFGCACVCVVIGCFGICACRSHWSGCVKVACRRGCMRNTIVFCSWRL